VNRLGFVVIERNAFMKRYIIEFGMGTDFHGQDVTRAAVKAVKDALSHSCLCGLEEILEIKNPKEEIHIHVTVAVPRPEAVDTAAVAEALPVGTVDIKAVAGGLHTSGLYVPKFGDADDSIEAALACVEVEICQ
jgi:uncharacterized protein (TIGR02058 family)